MQPPNSTSNTAASSGICFSREDKAVAGLGRAAYGKYVRSPRRDTNAVWPPENKFRNLGSHERKHVELLGAGSSPITARAGIYGLERGDKRYELSNHLGNVLAVVSDRRAKASCADTLVHGYWADIMSTTDYYPFGMGMVERGDDGGYRYGFNGMQRDDEFYGSGNSYTTEFRNYDPRIGQWLSSDPLLAKFPWQSPYVGVDNNPITLTDAKGLAADGWIKDKETGQTSWDNDVNSQGEFDDSGYDKNRYSYEGQNLQLPSGNGSISVTEWDPIVGNPDDNGISLNLVSIDIIYSGDKEYDWFQTYETNNPSATGSKPMGEVLSVLSEHIDATVNGVTGPTDPTQSDFYAEGSYWNRTFSDMHVRYGQIGETTYWTAQTTLVTMNADGSYISEITLSWGFIINSDGTGTVQNITVKEAPSEFHRKGFENLPKY